MHIYININVTVVYGSFSSQVSPTPLGLGFAPQPRSEKAGLMAHGPSSLLVIQTSPQGDRRCALIDTHHKGGCDSVG